MFDGVPCDENVVNVVGVNLIGVADDEYIDGCGDGVDGMVDENGDWVVRRVVDGGRGVVTFVNVVVGFAACVL